MIIKTMSGLGDCIYLRPIVRKLPGRTLVLDTAWPQVFQDLSPSIRFIKPERERLRTQSDNVDSFPESFWHPHMNHDVLLSYHHQLKRQSITSVYCDQVLGEQPKWLNNEWLPQFQWLGPNPFPRTEKPICLIRPTTLRKEWFITSRGPDPKYLQAFVDRYKDQYYIVSIASIKPGQEWYEKRIEGCDEYIEECTFEKTYNLFAQASLIVCSVSFWVPMALTMNKRTLCIYGGHVPPERIVDPRIRRDNYFELVPEPFCPCYELVHDCNKTIDPKIMDQTFEEFTNGIR